MTQAVATRNTIQRTLVLDAVRSLHDHPTSADVYELVSKKHPNISRATVYRNLGVLVSRGDVRKVEIPGGADRFDFQTHDHHHAQCRVCGQVVDVATEKDDIMSHAKPPTGFVIERHQVMFSGLCPDCAQM